jgi:hypothetical protein
VQVRNTPQMPEKPAFILEFQLYGFFEGDSAIGGSP